MPPDADAQGARRAPREFSRTRRRLFFLLLCGAFLFRLAFGLCSQFWADDERQVYLIGLKFYATGAWPFFGPDVSSGVQVPGALQGLLVGLPLFVAPVPEAPFVLLNLLSFASLCLFAWYCMRRLPGSPRWFVWGWLLTAPWTLNFSTHVVNPSYVLPGAILFFVGALETYPATRERLVPALWANLMMGFALLWVMQLHLSWVVLVPFLLASLYFQLRERGTKALAPLGWLACGAALSGCLLAPTLLKYGLKDGAGGAGALFAFNAANLPRVLNPVEGVPARFLSLASFELARFTGRDTAERAAFLRENLWLAPFALFVGAVGIIQPAAMIALWFRKRHARADWPAVKWLALLTVVLLCALFLFTPKAPASHTFYVTFPVAALYGFYCWDALLARRGWRAFAAIFLACGLVFHAGLAAHNLRRVSLYVERETVRDAIAGKNPSLLGERRPGSLY
ncbi:MAG TPA: hypothetical protein VHU19_03820 [Pyrinomonadaceae bacterium]|nr:hypothetical protein [Pyrinomonadaceae bacterium]